MRAVAHRFAFAFLVGAAFVLMLVGRADEDLSARVRPLVDDVIAPVLAVMAEPVAAFESAASTVEDFFYVYRENGRLREENERLLQWQNVARRLEQENAAYRTLLNARTDPRLAFISARVVGESGGPFVRTMMLNAGNREGVGKGMAVVGAEGLVGHIVGAGDRASRVLLVTDLNSRVPVIVESSRIRAVLAGDNSDEPRLQFHVGTIEAGDRVVTSGHGGLFPPGLPVGVVARSGEGGIRIQPFVDFERLEYVRVIRHHAAAVVETATP